MNNQNNLRFKTYIDYTGFKLGPLEVIKKLPSVKRNAQWECKCICGKIFNQSSNSLSRKIKKIQSGRFYFHVCRKTQPIDQSIIGKIFNRLTVIEIINNKNGRTFVKCQCICGNIKNISTNSLNSDKTQSCGCLRKEQLSKRNIENLDKINKYSKFCIHNWFYINNDIKIFMRSSYEIRFAEILDQKGIKWEYEPKIFKLKEGVRYIPDFYVPNENQWYEVKGRMKKQSQEKINEFIRQGYKLKIILLKDLQKEHAISHYMFEKEYKIKMDRLGINITKNIKE